MGGWVSENKLVCLDPTMLHYVKLLLLHRHQLRTSMIMEDHGAHAHARATRVVARIPPMGPPSRRESSWAYAGPEACRAYRSVCGAVKGPADFGCGAFVCARPVYISTRRHKQRCFSKPRAQTTTRGSRAKGRVWRSQSQRRGGITTSSVLSPVPSRGRDTRLTSIYTQHSRHA